MLYLLDNKWHCHIEAHIAEGRTALKMSIAIACLIYSRTVNCAGATVFLRTFMS